MKVVTITPAILLNALNIPRTDRNQRIHVHIIFSGSSLTVSTANESEMPPQEIQREWMKNLKTRG